MSFYYALNLLGDTVKAVNYFGNRLFDASTLKGAGNRIVAQMAETSGGQALLNTFFSTTMDTGADMFTALLKDTIRTWYDPKAERMSEEELKEMIYTSLVANLVINGMQNFVAYQRGLRADTGPSEADEGAMMRGMAGEEPEAEMPKGRQTAEAEEAEMMGAMEDNIRGRMEADAERPKGRQTAEAEEAEMMGAMEDNIRGRMEADAEIPGRQLGDQDLLASEKMKNVDAQEKELMGELEKNIEIEGEGVKLSTETAEVNEARKKELQLGEDSKNEFTEILKNETNLGKYSDYNDTISTGVQGIDSGIINENSLGAKKIIHRDGRVEIIGEGDIIETIDKRPYLDPKNRPSFRKGVPEKVFERVRKKYGVVKDPLTGTVIEWEPGQPRNGVWDMGHTPTQKYSEVHQRYLKGEMTPKEFRDWYNNPDNYRPELPSTNRSHKIE